MGRRLTHARLENDPPTLRSTWLTTMGQLLVVIACLGTVSFAVTQYQGSVFTTTSSALEAEVSSLAAIDVALLELDTVLPSVLYGLGGADQSAAAEEYERTRNAIETSLDDASAAVTTDVSRQLLDDVQRSWAKTHTAITAAMKAANTEDVLADLAQGRDPFATTVWANDTVTNETLSALRTQLAHDFRDRTAKARRLQNVTGPVVVGGLVVAMTLAWFSSRRMARLVIRPLADLRIAAEALRSLEPAGVDRDRRGVSEVRAVKSALDETAHSLRYAHTLLEIQAATDALTGLPNRRAFTDVLQRLFSDCDDVVVVFVDIDDFKQINDSMGHSAGDQVLQIVAKRLRSCVRSDACVARPGGDEFAIAMRGSGYGQELGPIGERILAAVGEPVSIGGRQLRVGCSVGLASGPHHPSETPDELVARADSAMYQAKLDGKGRFALSQRAPGLILLP